MPKQNVLRHKSCRLILALMCFNLNNKEIGIPAESFQLCLNRGLFGRRDLKRHLNEIPGLFNQYMILVVWAKNIFPKMIKYLSKLTIEASCGLSGGFL